MEMRYLPVWMEIRLFKETQRGVEGVLLNAIGRLCNEEWYNDDKVLLYLPLFRTLLYRLINTCTLIHVHVHVHN